MVLSGFFRGGGGGDEVGWEKMLHKPDFGMGDAILLSLRRDESIQSESTSPTSLLQVYP